MRNATVVAWAGMRGAVSLAAALAIPLETDTGAPFPGRELIIFLAFCVILVTLVGQGMTLPTLIRALGIEDDGGDAREEAKARKRAAMAALARLEELTGEDWVQEDTADAPARALRLPRPPLRRALRRRRRRLERGAIAARTSACAASSWTPSALPSSSSGARAWSRTT